jgi:hypothetical protein
MGPMLVGSPRKVTPRDLRRRHSDWMSLVMTTQSWECKEVMSGEWRIASWAEGEA